MPGLKKPSSSVLPMGSHLTSITEWLAGAGDVVVVVVAGAGGGGEHTHSITESDAMWAPVPSQPQFLTWGYSA
jgi:hypothetical protein